MRVHGIPTPIVSVYNKVIYKLFGLIIIDDNIINLVLYVLYLIYLNFVVGLYYLFPTN